jgi:beta-lactamase regulating signal transducer with metallopeptidase domain
MTPISIFLKASILISAALTHAVWGGRRSAATRHLMWTFTIGGFCCFLRCHQASPLTAFTASVPKHGRQRPQRRRSRPPSSSPVTLSTPETPPPQQTKLRVLPANLPLSTLLTVIYTGGVLFLLARLVFDRVSIARLVRQAAPMTDPDWQSLLDDCAEKMNLQRPIRLVRSREETMPMALGVRNGTILIPAVADTWSGPASSSPS